MSGSAALAAAKRRRVGPDMGNVVLSNKEPSASEKRSLSNGEALEVHEKKLDQLYNFHLSNRGRINDIEELLKELCAQHNSSVDEMKKLDAIIKEFDVNTIQNELETKQAERDSNLETMMEEKLGVFQVERDSNLETMLKKLDEKDEELILIKKDMDNLNIQIKNLQEIIENQQMVLERQENNDKEQDGQIAREENNNEEVVGEQLMMEGSAGHAGEMALVGDGGLVAHLFGDPAHDAGVEDHEEVVGEQLVMEENNNEEVIGEQLVVKENNNEEVVLKENNELFGETPVALEKPKTADIKEKTKSAGTKRGRGRKPNKNAVDSKIPRCAEKDEIAVENIIFDNEEKTIDEKNEK